MSSRLTQQIIEHIFANLGIIKSSPSFGNKFQELVNSSFLLNKKISFEMEDGNIISNNIWGCQLKINEQELKILLGDVSRDVTDKEYCLLVHLQNQPMYGIYYILDSSDPQALIAYSINGLQWFECSIYLQGTFLAAMEQIKEYFIMPQPCYEYDSQYTALISFIDFHSTIFENSYER